ncbi:hypothetical protein ACIHFD_56455 [Nonomuraea sp. NPDC051941]|uniref:hypothetical protein n=1 Tax=Nonomuraea sp. NPDC051941 TaxID=3364373 RepID=UPI0037C9656C
MSKSTQRAINARLKQLRTDWRRWRGAKTDNPGRIDFDLICPQHPNQYGPNGPITCGDPTCEGCAATAYRADRLREIKAETDALRDRA